MTAFLLLGLDPDLGPHSNSDILVHRDLIPLTECSELPGRKRALATIGIPLLT